jgi:hypothetical protein
MTTRGSEIDRLYFGSVHASYRSLSFGLTKNFVSGFQTTNRNYTTLIHGVENRKECIALLEEKESVSFVRNTSFPPLKTSVITKKNILAQNQIYDNSFAINSQRITDESLDEMGKELLTKIKKFAMLDISLNNLCVSIEIKQRFHLSFRQKVEILLYHEIMRHIHQDNRELFHLKCEKFNPRNQDESYQKYFFLCHRQKRQNPEMVDIYHLLPLSLQIILINRWMAEGKLQSTMCAVIPHVQEDIDTDLPFYLSEWQEKHIYMLADEICEKLMRQKKNNKYGRFTSLGKGNV